MKICPQCLKTFPDAERFCDKDGSALVPAGTAGRITGRMEAAGAGEAQPILCPVCGGKAEAGELICNFCGARLGPETAAPAGPAISTSATTQQSFDDEPLDSAGGRRSVFGTAGYVIAALLALAAGAWFAIHLSNGTPPIGSEATPTPVSSPAASGPTVALSDKVGIRVTGESAAAPERNQDAAQKVFTDNSPALLDLYKRSLAGDGTLHDGMAVRLRVMPTGEVTDGKVLISTAPNPALDEQAVKTMMGWRFNSFGGTAVEVDYPVIFARDGADRDAIDSALADNLAHLDPSATPEYEFSETSTPTPEPTPELTPTPTPTPAPAPVHHRKPARKPTPQPTPLLTMVQNRLAGDPRFRRVKAYTDNGTVTLFGKVFDDPTKLAAERAVRGVPGVTSVVDTLTTDKEDWAENQEKINRELQNSGLAKVTATVIGHDCYLKGQVTTDSEKQRAVMIAEQTAPVKVRVNLIMVVPGSIF
jgi:TonB family protein